MLIKIGALINKNTFEGGALIVRGGAYWQEGAISNHYSISADSNFSLPWAILVLTLAMSSLYMLVR